MSLQDTQPWRIADRATRICRTSQALQCSASGRPAILSPPPCYPTGTPCGGEHAALHLQPVCAQKIHATPALPGHMVVFSAVVAHSLGLAAHISCLPGSQLQPLQQNKLLVKLSFTSSTLNISSASDKDSFKSEFANHPQP